MTTLYETDFVQWADTQAQLLRAEEFEKVDWTNLIEEIEDLSATQRRELRSRLVILLMHLLKWEFQPSHRSRSWKVTIVNQRVDIDAILDESPSLRHALLKAAADAYPRAILKAEAETNLPASTFPKELPYSLDQIISHGYFPE